MLHLKNVVKKLNYIFLSNHQINTRKAHLVLPVWFCWWTSVHSWVAIEDVCILDLSAGKQEGIWTPMTCCASGFDVMFWLQWPKFHVRSNKSELTLKLVKMPVHWCLAVGLPGLLCKNMISLPTLVIASTAFKIRHFFLTKRGTHIRPTGNREFY